MAIYPDSLLDTFLKKSEKVAKCKENTLNYEDLKAEFANIRKRLRVTDARRKRRDKERGERYV
jgi:hypothetical protein